MKRKIGKKNVTNLIKEKYIHMILSLVKIS